MADLEKIKLLILPGEEILIALTDGVDSSGTKLKLVKPHRIVPVKGEQIGLIPWPIFSNEDTVWINLLHVTVQCAPQDNIAQMYNVKVHGSIVQPSTALQIVNK